MRGPQRWGFIHLKITLSGEIQLVRICRCDTRTRLIMSNVHETRCTCMMLMLQ